MSASYRVKIATGDMSARDWVDFLKSNDGVAVSTQRALESTEWYYTHIGTEFYFTTARADVRSSERVEYAEVEMVSDFEKAEEIEAMRLTEAPFGELLDVVSQSRVQSVSPSPS